MEEVSEMIMEIIREYNDRGEDINRKIIKTMLKGKVPPRIIQDAIRQLVKDGVLTEHHKTVGHGRPVCLSIADPDDETTVNQKLNVVLEYLVTIMNRDDKIVKALIRIEETLRNLMLERKN